MSDDSHRLHVSLRLGPSISAWLEEVRGTIGFPAQNVLMGTLRPCAWPDQGKWELVVTAVPSECVKGIKKAAKWPKKAAERLEKGDSVNGKQ